MKYILSLDQGTTSSRATIFDKSGNVVSFAQQEFTQVYPKVGYVEHRPNDILASVMSVMAQALVGASIAAEDLAAIGITNQRETTLVWNRKTGKPVYNAIVWQCRRTANVCDKLKKDGFAEKIYNKTGLIPDAYFSATKIGWILDNVDGARKLAENGELCFGTVDTFILWHLTKGKVFATDYTNAARTMLFNIHSLKWDEELLRLFDIPETMLPEVHPSRHNYGVTDEGVFGAKVKICSLIGDQQSALFGQMCVNSGEVKNTYGTGCFLLMNTGERAVKSRNGLITTLGASESGKPCYVLEGSVFVGGAVVQWLRDGLKVIDEAAESQALAESVPDSGGVCFVPAFTGLGAPYWDGEARGMLTGVTRGTTAAHIVRASLESIAYQVYDLVKAMEKDAKMQISFLAVDGGASRNDFLMGFQADILNIEVKRPCVSETTSLGAAYLAGLESGFWSGLDEIKSNVTYEKIFTPSMDESRRNCLLDNWQNAVKRTLFRP